MKIEHYQQKSHWDCGVSCVLMALAPAQRKLLLDRFELVCAEEGFGSSTWSIDLCYLLKRFLHAATFVYTTVTLGVNPGYTQQRFYSRILDADSKRVQRRFDEAKANGIHVECRKCDIDEIVAHLSSPPKGPIITLVDANRLHASSSSCPPFMRACFSPSSSFQGHYILCTGFDAASASILYHNPSSSATEQPAKISLTRFEEARSSYGTDEDLIFIFYDK